MSSNYWLSEEQFHKIRPLLPNKPRGVARVDDRRVLSGIIFAFSAAIAGRMSRLNTARPRRSATGTSGGPKRAFSNGYSTLWPATAPTFRR